MKKIFKEREIKGKVYEISRRINFDYWGKNPFFLIVLKGGFPFGWDLIRYSGLSPEIQFAGVFSYGEELNPSENLKVNFMFDLKKVKDRNVLIIDDILDTGKSFEEVKRSLEKENPRSIEGCVLFERDKGIDRVKYVGFKVREEDGFLVGYGMGKGDKFRTLKDVYSYSYLK